MTTQGAASGKRERRVSFGPRPWPGPGAGSHSEGCLSGYLQAGKGVRAREQDSKQAPVEVETVGEIPDPTVTQQVTMCCPRLIAPEVTTTVRQTVIQAPSPGNFKIPEHPLTGRINCLREAEVVEAEEVEVSPLVWEPLRGRRSGRVSKPPVRWSPSHMAPGARSRSKRARVEGGKRGALPSAATSSPVSKGSGGEFQNPLGEGEARGSQAPRPKEVRTGLSDQMDDWPQHSGDQF